MGAGGQHPVRAALPSGKKSFSSLVKFSNTWEDVTSIFCVKLFSTFKITGMEILSISWTVNNKCVSNVPSAHLEGTWETQATTLVAVFGI